MMTMRRAHHASPLPSLRSVKIPHTAAPMRARQSQPSRGEFVSSVGHRIRAMREASCVSGGKLAQTAGISRSMLSRIERGLISPSMETLECIADALAVPVALFFAGACGVRSICHVREGRGLGLDTHLTPIGHRYEMLGNAVSGSLAVESCMVVMDMEAELLQPVARDGVVFIYVLEGAARFTYGSQEMILATGDAMLFDAAAIHGVTAVECSPVRFLTTTFNTRA